MTLARIAAGCFLCVLGPLSGTELKPWFGPELVPQIEAEAIVQIFEEVDTRDGDEKYASCDFFIDLGALIAPTADTSVELEVIGADTRSHSFGADTIKLTGRYLWLNDVVGDLVSLSTGISIAQVFKPFSRDLAVFHNGGIEGELHVAIGKEAVCQAFWTSRWWGVLGVGIGDLGSPMCRADLHYDWNWWDRHHCGIFLHSLWGLGSRDLHSVKHFHGYGPIRHQSVDLGVSYTFCFQYDIFLEAEYLYRAYAKNCPSNASIIFLRFVYPFGL